MHRPYKTRQGGCTVTVFVPYDCNNHCPFCVNKGEYADMTGFSLEKICESIEVMDSITPACDFVFTGGEPFANLESLQVMLDKVPSTHHVYINTTLPVSKTVTEEDILAFTEKNKDKISCINVSRHMQHYVVESNDELLARIGSDILDLIINGRIDLIVNTPEGETGHHDDSYLRKGAIRAGVPYITTVTAARAAAEGIHQMLRSGDSGILPLQEWHEKIETEGS